jgi:aminomethyltransferase
MGLKRTPLHASAARHGARFVDFTGWELPVQFEGVVAEHRAVRSACGLFDVSHMARFHVSGAGAESFLDRLLTNNIRKLAPGALFYTALCQEDGGTIDDLVVYRFDDRYLVVANAANHDAVWAWLESHKGPGVTLEDHSTRLAQLALQGPRSQEVLARVLDVDLEPIGYYRFAHASWKGTPLLVSRNGYTGEDGFELYPNAADAASLWSALFEAGEGVLSPAGLGARDTLRLEVAYPLYGHELGRETTPIQAGLGWVVKLKDRAFIGADRLRAEKEAGPARTLVGLEFQGPVIARQGATLTLGGSKVGAVTSGTHGPSVGRGIGMALVAPSAAGVGTRLVADVRGRSVEAVVVTLPFYKEGSHR